MERTPEPELMDDEAQALAYHKADMSDSHSKRIELFQERVPKENLSGQVLDLGCGSGDIIFRFARAFPEYSFVAVDGAEAMLNIALEELAKDAPLVRRIKFVQAFIPSEEVPKDDYSVIMSHSFLHHLHNPAVLWETVKDRMTSDTFIFIADLRRPESEQIAREIVEERAGAEAEVHRKDFYNSLLAAFTKKELEAQMKQAGIHGLKVEEVGDIHILVHGKPEIA